MRLSLLAGLSSAFFMAAAIVVGCGGNVVVDGDGGAGGGSGGAGGSTTSTSITTNTSTSITTNTSVSVSSSSVTTTTSSSFVSSSSGPNGCDNSGDCGDNGAMGGCINCAIEGPACNGIYTKCIDAECQQYTQCLENCGGPNCEEQCAQQFPESAQLYQALLECVFCGACPNDCAEYAQGFCP